MSISVNIHRPTRMAVDRSGSCSWINVHTAELVSAGIFAPRHVCEATARAFNRAMQVKCMDGGMIYVNDAGLWHITTIHGPWTVWHAQHDEITGDGDPEWMTADAPSLEELQDALDDIAAERKEDAA